MPQMTEGKITCPNCGHEQAIKVYRSINAQSDEAEKADIMMNNLFVVKCDECKERIPLLYNCLYHDEGREAMYWLLPSMQDSDLVEMNQVLKEMEKAHIGIADNDHYRYRKVLTVNELREKILIAEQNLDDRIIEILKVMYLAHLADQIGDKVVSEVLFDVIDDIYYIEIFYENPKLDPGVIIPDMEIYQQVKEQYLEQLDALNQKEFMQIDFEWAKRILFGQ